jgi:hypothetical protein
MYETYPPSVVPPVPIASNIFTLKDYIAHSQLLLDLLAINSFALNMRIDTLSMTRSTTDPLKSPELYAKITMQVPINLWSQQVLRQRGDHPTNDFDIKLLQALGRQEGLTMTCLSTTVTNEIDVTHIIHVA